MGIHEMKNYIQKYLKETAQICELICQKEIANVTDILLETKDNGGRLFILGLGGSAGNASHAVNDFRKIAQIETYAPTDNVSELTAWTNDNGFEFIFTKWLETSKLGKSDTILILSVGGGSDTTSQNLVLAMEYAKSVNAKVTAIVGRNGGKARLIADASVLIPTVHQERITPHAEGWQGIVWHLVVNAICELSADFSVKNNISRSEFSTNPEIQ